MLYLLTNGNRIALQHRRYADVATFHHVERAWAIAGWISFPFSTLLLLAYIGALLSATTKVAGSVSATLPGCWSCGCATTAGWKFCGDCGCNLALVPGDWQASVYLGKHQAALYRRAPHEIRELLPVLFAPFGHLHAIPANRWRWIVLTAVMGLFPLALVAIVGRTNDAVDGFKGVAFYFSAIWALFFASAFRAAGLSWRLSLLDLLRHDDRRDVVAAALALAQP